MNWISDIRDSLAYIEEHLTGELTVDEIAARLYVSPFYFQKGFSMMCGMSVGEYIRNRRLSMAGSEMLSTNQRVIDIAMKYGYDSPDSFTKAFTRFHGATPSAVRKDGKMIRSFAPLILNFSLKGGYVMDYKIVEKEAFQVLAAGKKFTYDEAKKEIPLFWNEHYTSGRGKVVCGMYGINIDESMGHDTFEYLIADDYVAGKEVPAGFEVREVPKLTWAVFACRGKMPESFQQLNQQVFTEWLPNNKEYEFAAGYNVEMYDDPAQYPLGVQDPNYYCEMWIPVKKK